LGSPSAATVKLSGRVSGRYAKLEPMILKAFDVPYMTRMAVRQSWAATPELKQHQVAEAFGRYITATWADRFDSYSGEKLEVTGEQPYAAGNLVHPRIVESNGEPVGIDYLMRRNGEAWQNRRRLPEGYDQRAGDPALGILVRPAQPRDRRPHRRLEPQGRRDVGGPPIQPRVIADRGLQCQSRPDTDRRSRIRLAALFVHRGRAWRVSCGRRH